jgi:nitrate/TMAO reductase-like tetraheme cytochrome c subunit
MGTSTSISALGWGTLGAAGLAALIIVWYLIRRPSLTPAVKISLFFAIGALPGVVALTGNLAGMQQTTRRGFCAGCHVMLPWTNDAADVGSKSLASRHSRNELFGEQSCYTCHADYGMFGFVTTKMTALKHVWHYWKTYGDLTIEEAVPRIHIYQPFPNSTCMHCHSTKVPSFERVSDHAGLREEIVSGKIGCASEGCHGPAHPFSKRAQVTP